nr:hypothetical protein [Massilia oculi]
MKAPKFEKLFAQLALLNQPQGQQVLAALHPAAGLNRVVALIGEIRSKGRRCPDSPPPSPYLIVFLEKPREDDEVNQSTSRLVFAVFFRDSHQTIRLHALHLTDIALECFIGMPRCQA